MPLTPPDAAEPELGRSPCPPKTAADLEWPLLLQAVAARCVSEEGRARAVALELPSTRAAVRRAAARTGEALALLQRGEPLPLVALPSLVHPLARAAASGVLAASELVLVARSLEAARQLRRFLAARREVAPALVESCTTDATLDALAEALSSAFDADGTLADHASPRLRDLRQEQRAARARMISRLEELMRRYEPIVQDHFVTEREGRWVIPVRSDAHERFPGIVHATSASGATLFVEPRAVIPMGNRLKVLDAEIEREELAILAALTERVREQIASATFAVEALARADFHAAAARLASEHGMILAELSDTPRFALVRARHPLLLLDGVDVVASDLELEAGHALVVSGPNAGGKTVALKTLGLAALSARAGLPFPCTEGSVIGIFDEVLTDVGDDQSLSKNLSTFSAHVQNLVAICEQTHRGTLVLLDELAGGTDPREGEALAAAVLDSLTARGGAVAVTTHYEGLKVLASSDARFTNASVGFDLATMTPTFRFQRGVPGASSALAVARRFGLPPSIAERAERYLTREDVAFDEVVRRLELEQRALELARASCEERERELAAAKARFDAELRDLRERGLRAVERDTEALKDAVRRAREDVRAAQALLRKKPTKETVRDAERLLERAGKEVALGGVLDTARRLVDDSPSPSEHELARGARVHLKRLNAPAQVLDVLPDGSLRVMAGALKLTVDRSEVARADGATERAPARSRDRSAPPAQVPARATPAPVVTKTTTCDLRGMRVDDALAMLGSFLDRVAHDGEAACLVLHGHGTGALRDAVRRDLRTSPYVRDLRPGAADEGGDGVTYCVLA